MTSKRITTQRVKLLVAVMLMSGVVDLRAGIPIITSITPSRGPTGGGTVVTITGNGFVGTTSVTFGGTAAVFAVDGDTKITATTPAKPAGAYDVVVTTPDSTATASEAFSYGNVPTALGDTFSTPFQTPLQVFAPGVLSNDNTNDGGTMVASLVSNVTNGFVTLSNDGSFTYTPNPGFSGTETFTYRAMNDAGTGNLASVIVTVTLPTTAQPPIGLVASRVSGNQVTFRWTPSPVGLASTEFEIEVGVNPGEVQGNVRTGSPYPIFTATLPTGALYVRVRSIAGVSRSGPSNEIRVFVNVPVVPSTPENLVGVVNGATLGLAWRNTFAGGEPTGLVLDVTGTLAASIPLGLTDNFSFVGVPAGTYTLSLRATNASGTSGPSTPITLTFPGPCSGPPLAPANFLAYKIGNTIFVVWDPAATGPAPTSYVLNVTGAFVGSIPTNARALNGTVGAGSYSLSVTAFNACGGSTTTGVQTISIP